METVLMVLTIFVLMALCFGTIGIFVGKNDFALYCYCVSCVFMAMMGILGILSMWLI